MNPIQEQQITEALPNVQPLLDALAGLPDQGSADPTVRQCLDAGRSLAEWTTRLAVESPTAKDTTIPKEVLEHVVTVARFANGSAFKLFTKAVDAKNDKLAAQYKWVADLTNYLHRVFAVLWWDYIPPAPPAVASTV